MYGLRNNARLLKLERSGESSKQDSIVNSPTKTAGSPTINSDSTSPFQSKRVSRLRLIKRPPEINDNSNSRGSSNLAEKSSCEPQDSQKTEIEKITSVTGLDTAKSNHECTKSVVELGKVTELETRTCTMCSKEILAATYSSHLFHCMNRYRRTKPNLRSSDKAKDSREGETLTNSPNNNLVDEILECPFCSKYSSNPKWRLAHMSKCAKSKNYTVEQYQATIDLQVRQLKERKAAGLSTAPAKPIAAMRATSRPTISEPKTFHQEDIQVAKALSLSLRQKTLAKDAEENFLLQTAVPKLKRFDEKMIKVLKKKVKVDKKNKKVDIIPLLLLRTSGDRARIIADRVAEILSEPRFQPDLDTCAFYINWNELKLKRDTPSNLESCRLWTLSSLAKNVTQDPKCFYTPVFLDFEHPCTTIAPVHRRLSEIPGYKLSSSKEKDKSVLSDENEDPKASVESTQNIIEQLYLRNNNAESNLSVREDYKEMRDGFFTQATMMPERNATLIGNLLDMVGNSSLSDMKIQVESDIKIPCHQFIIFARCPFAYEELCKMNSDEKILNWSNVSHGAAMAFLKYLYAECTPDEVYKIEIDTLARKYKILELVEKNIITEQLETSRDKDNTFETLVEEELATSHVEEETVASQVENESVTSQLEEETVASQVENESVTSQLEEETVALQVEKEAVASQVEKKSVASQVEEETMTSQVEEETMTSQVEETMTSQVAELESLEIEKQVATQMEECPRSPACLDLSDSAATVKLASPIVTGNDDISENIDSPCSMSPILFNSPLERNVRIHTEEVRNVTKAFVLVIDSEGKILVEEKVDNHQTATPHIEKVKSRESSISDKRVFNSPKMSSNHLNDDDEDIGSNFLVNTNSTDFKSSLEPTNYSCTSDQFEAKMDAFLTPSLCATTSQNEIIRKRKSDDDYDSGFEKRVKKRRRKRSKNVEIDLNYSDLEASISSNSQPSPKRSPGSKKVSKGDVNATTESQNHVEPRLSPMHIKLVTTPDRTVKIKELNSKKNILDSPTILHLEEIKGGDNSSDADKSSPYLTNHSSTSDQLNAEIEAFLTQSSPLVATQELDVGKIIGSLDSESDYELSLHERIQKRNRLRTKKNEVLNQNIIDSDKDTENPLSITQTPITQKKPRGRTRKKNNAEPPEASQPLTDNMFLSPVEPSTQSTGNESSSSNSMKSLPIDAKTATPKRRGRKAKEQTPMPRYSLMNTPEISQKLKSIGVKNLGKKRGVKILKHVFKETHKGSSTDDGVTLSSSQSSSKTDSSSIQKSESESSSSNIQIFAELNNQMTTFIKTHKDIYERLVQYEPVDIDTLHKKMLDNGVQHNLGQLKTFMDKECLVYKDSKDGSRRRQRKGSQK